jgi:hypothetical protein
MSRAATMLMCENSLGGRKMWAGMFGLSMIESASTHLYYWISIVVPSRWESEERYAHQPFCPLVLWFRELLRDLLDHKGWLIPVTAVLVLSLDICGIAPSLSVSDM